MPETPWENDVGFGLNHTRSWIYSRTVWTILCCVWANMSYWFRWRQRRQRGQRNGRWSHSEKILLTLVQGSCKEVEVCKGSLFIYPFLLSCSHFASTGKMHTQARHVQDILSYHHEQEHPTCVLKIIWVHAWIYFCPSHSSPSYHCFQLECVTGLRCLLFEMRVAELAET